jgi:hypothetical protein
MLVAMIGVFAVAEVAAVCIIKLLERSNMFIDDGLAKEEDPIPMFSKILDVADGFSDMLADDS